MSEIRNEVQERRTTRAEMLRREGEARGKAEGKREALLLQLRQRFGRLPAAAVARIDKAAAAALDVWSSRELTASSSTRYWGRRSLGRPMPGRWAGGVLAGVSIWLGPPR